jgi:hypothetical protein
MGAFGIEGLEEPLLDKKRKTKKLETKYNWERVKPWKKVVMSLLYVWCLILEVKYHNSVYNASTGKKFNNATDNCTINE